MVKMEKVRKDGRKWVKVSIGKEIKCNRVQLGFDEWRRFILVCNKWIGPFGGFWVNYGHFEVPWDSFWRIIFENNWGDYFRDLWFGQPLNGRLVQFEKGRYGIIIDGVSLHEEDVRGSIRWFRPLWLKKRSKRGKALGRFELVPGEKGVRIIGFVPFSQFGIVTTEDGFKVVNGPIDVENGVISWNALNKFNFVSILRNGGRVWGDVSVDLVFRVNGFEFKQRQKIYKGV